MADADLKPIIIIADPNVAGKTTFASSFLPEEANLTHFINADQIAVGLAAFAPETAAIRADRLMLAEIQHCSQRGDSFAFETTLAGLIYLKHVEKWRAQGYQVSLYFLSLPDAETAIARVASRVRQGGHDIPESVIRRRFAASRENFRQHHQNAVDDWAHYDNTGSELVLIGWGEKP